MDAHDFGRCLHEVGVEAEKEYVLMIRFSATLPEDRRACQQR